VASVRPSDSLRPQCFRRGPAKVGLVLAPRAPTRYGKRFCWRFGWPPRRWIACAKSGSNLWLYAIGRTAFEDMPIKRHGMRLEVGRDTGPLADAFLESDGR
jgi:hypothetical protein